MLNSSGLEIDLVTTPEMLQRIYHFRYQVYIEEMGRKQYYADHARKLIIDPLDDHANVVAATNTSGEVVGTLRINFLKESNVGYYIDLYGLGSVESATLEKTAIFTRLMIAKAYRGSPLVIELVDKLCSIVYSKGATEIYADCNAPVLAFFLGHGFKIVREAAHPEYGNVYVIHLSLTELPYIRSVKSPILRFIEANNG